MLAVSLADFIHRKIKITVSDVPISPVAAELGFALGCSLAAGASLSTVRAWERLFCAVFLVSFKPS